MNKIQRHSLLAPLGLFLLAQIFLAQPQWAWTLWPGLAFVFLGFWKLKTLPATSTEPKDQAEIKPRWETILFFLILALALFFRLFRLDSLPPGMHTDQGLTGLFALRILHEGWRPFHEILLSQVPDLLLTYQLAGWFGLAGAGSFSFHLFHILISLSAFPFIYWTFRQWAGARAALLSLFFLAVMRWHWVETRNAVPSIEAVFYLFGALSFYFHGIRNRKPFSLFLSALFCGFGIFAYAALKAVPVLMAVISIYEYRIKKNETKMSRASLLAYFLLVTALSAPLINHMAEYQTFGKRESESFILKEVVKEKSLLPVLKVWTGTALMFNRTGDTNPQYNVPGRRMLDDFTAVFFLIGLASAWKFRGERKGFYPLAGFLVLLAAGLLSTQTAASARLVALTPFVAYLASWGALGLWDSFKSQGENKRGWIFAAAVIILSSLTAQNIWAYFHIQANDPDCKRAFGLEQNFIGQTIRQSGDSHYFVGPFYFHNPTVDFLSYPYRERVNSLNPADWAKGSFPRDKEAVLFLETGQNGTLAFFKTLFPSMTVQPLLDSDRRILLTQCLVPVKDLAAAKPWSLGLKGEYLHSTQWTDNPEFTRLDPVLNFSSLQDFGFETLPPYRIRWTGTLILAKPGHYQFQVLTEDRGTLWLDGKEIALEKHLRLKAGRHSLKLEYEKDSGYYTQLHLVWKKPGDEKWEVVPAEAFGKFGR